MAEMMSGLKLEDEDALAMTDLAFAGFVLCLSLEKFQRVVKRAPESPEKLQLLEVLEETRQLRSRISYDVAERVMKAMFVAVKGPEMAAQGIEFLKRMRDKRDKKVADIMRDKS